MRIIQPEGARGSLKWIQRAIEHRPDLLQPRGIAPITWRSPLRQDEFAEYRDGDFLARLDLSHLSTALADYLTRLNFVILDELGYLLFAQSGEQLLFHLISRLYERISVIVTALLRN